MQPAPQTAPRSPRFFALTPHRLKLARAARLSAGDLAVWAHVEIEAAPGRPKRFVLEQIASEIGMSPEAVGRSLKRLVALKVVTRRDLGGKVFLCPATTLHGHDAAVKEAPRHHGPGSDDDVARQGGSGRRPDQASVAQTQAPPVRTPDPKELEVPKTKKSFCPLDEEGTELVAELETRFGIWAAKGRKLVVQHGLGRVKEVVAFADFQADRLSNPGGWVQRALDGGWGAPDGFFQAKQPDAGQPKKLDHAAVVARVMTIRLRPDEFSDEVKLKTLLDAVAVGEAGAAQRLASSWGIALTGMAT